MKEAEEVKRQKIEKLIETEKEKYPFHPIITPKDTTKDRKESFLERFEKVITKKMNELIKHV